jgi:carbon-monoxide dehydrogenase iron sulfur subunit
MLACLPGAIVRDPKTNTVLIKPEICINCASCAMACPFGVLRYHEDPFAPPGKVVAVKCDNCLERQEQGLIPACVEACKVGALTFEDSALAQKTKTDQVALATLSHGEAALPPAPGFELQNAHKRSLKDLETR